jgi:hypothetical protein
MSKKKACFLHMLAFEDGNDTLSLDIGGKSAYDAPDKPEERNLNLIHMCPPALRFGPFRRMTSVETNVQ